MIYKNAQSDGDGIYHEKIYVQERDEYNEMWNGKRYGLDQVKKLGFDRVSERVDFKKDITNLNRFDRILLFEFKCIIFFIVYDLNNLKSFVVRSSSDFPINFRIFSFSLSRLLKSIFLFEISDCN